MADTMQFDLVAPEKRLASMAVRRVQIPGAEGEMTVMPGHEAVLSTLRPGFVQVDGPDGPHDFVVTHGFVEITGDSVSVIAERAVARAEAHRELLQPILEEARSRAAEAGPEHKDAAETFVADLVHLIDRMD
ncbi:MAG: F0F1 ATP synthase subunit epsilon [Rhodobacteraceae bacterium]|jgi:F-type H+-transporting ATPase subunit epsilon|nr:F0F1 ATP synthase subunit epsilon [Paracoccaceae bacterium]MBL4556292.1 F0F1 ATP synthase subunit epsilon [Paracoccaceae bacterium]HBG97712.1 ATP synthase F1 subunit epsilon [Paracoccaceae bacterium]